MSSGRLTFMWAVALGAFGAGCYGVALKTQGDRQVVEWSTPGRGHFGCATIPEELLQRLAVTRADGDAGPVDDETARLVDYEVHAYRACEAYANGVLDASAYATIVAPTPPNAPRTEHRSEAHGPGSPIYEIQ